MKALVPRPRPVETEPKAERIRGRSARPVRVALISVHKGFETRICTLVSRNALQVVRVDQGWVISRHAGPFL